MNKQQQKFLEKQMEMEHNQQLQKVRELEMKARFWKAQYDIRHYTLMAEELQKPYDEYVEAQRAKNEKAMKDYQDMLDKVSQEQEEKAKMVDHILTKEDLHINPELKESDLKIGELIGIPTNPDFETQS